MGAKYRDIVLKCISGEFGVSNDTREDLKLQQAFRIQVVEVLQRSWKRSSQDMRLNLRFYTVQVGVNGRQQTFEAVQ